MNNQDPRSDDLYRRVEALIRSVRRRRALRLFLRGVLSTAVVGVVLFFVSSWAMDRLLYTERAVSLIRVFAWVTFGAFALRQLVFPFFRRVSDRQVALYIEEHEPRLESALITSLEVGGSRAAGDPAAVLHERLLADTIERCERIDFGRGIERSALQRAAGGLTLFAAAALLLALMSPAFLRHGASLLLFPWNAAAADNPYGIVVSPTEGVFPKGADIRILARLRGFTDERVRLVRRPVDGEWTRESMVSSPSLDEEFGPWRGGDESNHGDYESLILAADRSFEYYVEAGGLRSVIASVDVIDLPYTDSIDLLYRYPDYSGLEQELIEDAGDIAALEGSEVELRVTPTIPTEGVRMVVEGEGPVDLVRSGEGTWTTSIDVTGAGFYHLEMLDARGRWNRASSDYSIRTLEDGPPILSIRTPGRDLRVNKIEEIFVEAVAEDDYGVRSMDLTWSLNGADPVTRTLASVSSADARKKLVVGHTFFLEEFDLQDGDFISYFVSARDGRPGAGERERSSDIYFLEVRPFSQDYRRADGGGGGGGGGGGAEAELSKRQREVVAATFRLIRDRRQFSDKEYEESVATVSLSQSRLSEQVRTLITRMGNRASLMDDENFTEIIGHLESALEPMAEAVESLSGNDLQEALSAEQEALAALQRAEAMFRDVRVSFQPGGGGGDGSGLAEDLADLFELELDKLRNQYETVQRGDQQQMDQEVDELEERLRELARRQQRENERRRRLGQSGAGGGGSQTQQELIEETEELARRLERLAREQGSPDLRQTAQELQRASDQMKRSGSEGQAGAGSSGIAAMKALEDARRLLDKNRRRSVEEGVGEVQSRAQRVAEDQQSIQEDVGAASGRAESGGGRPGREEMQRLLQRKEQLQKDVEGLEEELDRLARQSRGEQPELARSLQDAANELRTSGVAKKIEYSRAVLTEQNAELAGRFEESIRQDLEELLENVAEAGEALGKAQEGRASEDALAEARSLVEGLESLEQRLRDGQRRAAGGEPGQQQSEGGGESEGPSDGADGAGGAAGEGSEDEAPGGARGAQGEEQGEETGPGRAARLGEEGREGSTGSGGSRPAPGEEGPSREGPGERGAASGGRSGAQQGSGIPTMGSGTARGDLQPGAFSEEDLRQLGREVSQRVDETRDLRERLEAAGIDAADLRDIERQMARFDTRQLTNDPLALDELRRNIDELRQFEFSLWRSLQEGEAVVRTPRAQEIPEGYREHAERYFRALAGDDG